MQSRAGTAFPQSIGIVVKKLPGGEGGVRRVSSLTNGLTNGVDGLNGVLGNRGDEVYSCRVAD